MKTLIFLLLLIPNILFSQQKSDVIDLCGKSSEELFKNAREWLVLNTKPGNLFIQIDNPKEQKIIGTGVKNITYSLQKYRTYIDVNYAISLQFKEGSFDYSIYIKSIKYEDGFEISFEDFKLITTKEGWKSYLEKTGIRPVFNKKIATEGNRNAYALLKKDIDELITELTNYLKSNGKHKINTIANKLSIS